MRRLPDFSQFRNGRFPKIFLVLGTIAFFLATAAYTTGVRLEAHDSFCASCHVEPESTYYQASLNTTNPATSAAFHAGENTRCVDCHSRRWIPGRLWAQWGGLHNLLAYRSGHYTQPSVTTRPVGDSGCTKCHNDLTWVSERPGHYHSPSLRRRWRAAGGPTNSCATCHPPHQSVAPISEQFMDHELIEVQCDACHEATGEEGIELEGR